MARRDGEPTPVGERLIWGYSGESTRVLIVGRTFSACRRAAVGLNLGLRRWNAVVSPEAPAEWAAVYAYVDVIFAPSTTGGAAEGDADE